MKGTLIPSGVPPPHLKPIQNWVTRKWKPFPDEKAQIQIPVRPGQGYEVDTKICLRVNHFPINIKLPANIYHYDVDVTKVIDKNKPKNLKDNAKKSPKSKDKTEKKMLPRHLRYAIHRKLVDQLREAFLDANPGKKIGIISDRSTALYSTQELELSVPLEQTVEICGESGRRENFRVIVAPTVEKVDTYGLQRLVNNMKDVPITSDLDTLHRIYNILMKNLNCSRYVPIGRSSLISFEGDGYALGGGLLNFQGYDATIEITNGWKPFLNVHIANCATLLNKNVIEVFAELFELRPDQCRTTVGWKKPNFKLASDLLTSCKVKYFPLKDQSKVLGGTVTKVDPMSISQKKFWLEKDGVKREISIYDYFVEIYGRSDLHRDGPCLELNNRNYVPAEVCEVKKGQSINRKLSSKQTTKMLNCAKKPPNVLQAEIEQAASDLDLHNDPVLKDFGCSLGDKVRMLEMPETRKLANPLLCYASESNIVPANGVWDNYALKAKFLNPVKITKWGILYTSKVFDLPRSQSTFVTKLLEMATEVGVEFATSQPISHDLSGRLREQEDAAGQNIKVLSKCFNDIFVECEIVVVVVPWKPCHIYGHVKQAAEINIGLLTTCIAAANFNPQQPNRFDSIVGNVILKINSKLGGINHTVVNPSTTIPFTLFEQPVMIVGGDVTHGGCDGGYSFAAVTCSIDNSGMPYMMHGQAQQKAGKGSAEVIQNFDLIMRKCLIAYRVRTRSKIYPNGLMPRKIIYYRDGVGEGQFPEILNTEMRSMRKACTSLSPTYEPAITFITVQKRHKTRFFMQKDGKATEENAPPGTVVDTTIVHPTENDFFLVSHQGIKGTTVRPTRYHVLWDDSDFSADQIQQLTYYLCYMYVRCNRSVSIPAPTYYAHHAATRASVLAHGQTGSINEINEKLMRTELNKKSPMHFV